MSTPGEPGPGPDAPSAGADEAPPLLDAAEEDPSAEATAAGAGYAATSAGEGDAPIGPPSQDVAG